MKQARGMRNNNPLNIIKSEKINWQGEVKPSTDPNFAQFEPHLLPKTWVPDDSANRGTVGP